MKLLKRAWARVLAGIMWVVRLLNLLEPDVAYPVLSISKISMWATLGSTIYITIYNPTSEALATSLGAQVAATANYGVRRWIQAREKKGSYREEPCEDAQ